MLRINFRDVGDHCENQTLTLIPNNSRPAYSLTRRPASADLHQFAKLIHPAADPEIGRSRQHTGRQVRWPHGATQIQRGDICGQCHVQLSPADTMRRDRRDKCVARASRTTAS